MGNTTKRTITARMIPGLAAGRHRAAESLYLLVRRTGKASWVFRQIQHGREIARGLGSYPETTIDEAKRKTLRLRSALAHGEPVNVRRAAPAAAGPTVADALAAVAAANADAWSPPTVKAHESVCRCHVLPVLGTSPLASLTRETVVELVSGINGTAARKALDVIRKACEVGTARGWIATNPATGIDAALPQSVKRRRDSHHDAMPHAAVGAFLRGLLDAATSASRCLAFAILTGARSVEARGAEWSEIDLEAAVWTVAAERMKAGREHRVPLSGAAVAILRAQTGQHKTRVFPSARGGKMISATVLSGAVKDLDCTVHGFRSSFADWAAEVEHADHAVTQAALAHVTGSQTERAYSRTDYFDRRRPLMTAWADYLTA